MGNTIPNLDINYNNFTGDYNIKMKMQNKNIIKKRKSKIYNYKKRKKNNLKKNKTINYNKKKINNLKKRKTINTQTKKKYKIKKTRVKPEELIGSVIKIDDYINSNSINNLNNSVSSDDTDMYM